MNADCPVCGAEGAVAESCGKYGVEESQEEQKVEQKEEQKAEKPQEEKPQEEKKEEQKEEGAAGEKKSGNAATLQAAEGEEALRPVVSAEHMHCICGGDTEAGDHTSHSNVTFTPWNGTDDITYTNGEAYVYLTNDATINTNLDVDGNTLYLCLNGKTYASNGKNKITVRNGRLVLCDCDPDSSGVIQGANTDVWGGGCIYIYNSTLDIFGGKLTGGNVNRENGGGGAIALDDSECVLNLYGGEISGNNGYKQGGAILLNNKDGESGKVNLYGGTIRNNSAESGGAIYVRGAGTVTLSGANIEKNSADRGGAIYMNQSGKVELTGGTINENKANIVVMTIRVFSQSWRMPQ